MSEANQNGMKATTADRDYKLEFSEALTCGIDNIAQAARVYVEAIDANPALADEFAADFRDIVPASAWAGFEAVGRKWMHPRLLMGGGGRFASKIKRLPYHTQERIFNGDRFDMLLPGGDTIKVDVREAQQEQAEQLFDGNHIRTLAEQKLFLTKRASEPVLAHAEVMPYTINNGVITFRRGVSLTRQEIKRIIAVM
jgi:hypothetical protein